MPVIPYLAQGLWTTPPEFRFTWVTSVGVALDHRVMLVLLLGTLLLALAALLMWIGSATQSPFRDESRD